MGAELAVEEQNLAGGILGRKVLLLVEDSKSTSAAAVSAFRKSLAIDKPQIVMGDVWAYLVEPLIPMAKSSRTLIISPTVMPLTLMSGGDWYLTMGHKPENTAAAVAKFFDLNPSLRTISIFCWDSSWGAPYLALWRSEIEKRGITILDQVCVNDFGYDYRSDVTRIVAKKPDAVIIAHHAERIIKLFSEQHFRPLILSTSNIMEVLHGRSLDPKLAEGVYYTDWIPSEEFSAKFQNKYNTAPILEAYNSYELIRTIMHASQAQAPNLRVGFDSVHYLGVAGPIDFRGTFAGNQAVAKLVRVHQGITKVLP